MRHLRHPALYQHRCILPVAQLPVILMVMVTVMRTVKVVLFSKQAPRLSALRLKVTSNQKAIFCQNALTEVVIATVMAMGGKITGAVLLRQEQLLLILVNRLLLKSARLSQELIQSIV